VLSEESLLSVDSSRFSVFDGLNGSLLTQDYVQRCLASGVWGIHVTINNFGTIQPYPTLESALDSLAKLRRELDGLDEIIIVRTFQDIETARQTKKLAVLLGYQNMPGVGNNLALLDIFQLLGVRVIQLSHNARGLQADGCSESNDSGLSASGRAAIAELNRLGIIIDLSHVGDRSTVEALELSSLPCAATHANAWGVTRNKRNKSDAALDALKANGGIIGVCYLPPLVARSAAAHPTMDDVIAHMDYIAARIGVEHLGIGSDFIDGQPPERYQEFLRNPEIYGQWPWRFPVGNLSSQQMLFNELLKRGYSEEDVRKIAGENFIRIFQASMWRP
jgi:membrane dipeptidase